MPPRRKTPLPARLTFAALVAALVAAGLVAAAAPVSAETLLVPDDFATIQAAIDAAEPADVVLVEPGTYTENLTLVGNVDVRGRETARTWLRPDDASAAAVSIANVSAIRFSNFTLIDASSGVVVTGSSGIDIANVVFDGVSDVGLSVDGFSAVRASNNVFFENDTAVSRGSSNVAVESNIFRRNGTTIETLAQPGVDPLANVLSNCFSANSDVEDGDAGLGAGATVGDPLFVDPAARDFHLREDSPCIDAGRGTDVIDNTVADAGAYGGPFADAFPFPVATPTLEDATAGADAPAIVVAWPANLDYRVTNSVSPGGYRVHYKQGGAPEPPFDGVDAGGGTEPSPIDVGNVTTYTLDELSPAAASTPLAPRLLTATGRNEAAVVTWEAVQGATGYVVHYGIDGVGENAVDAGAGTSATVTGLVNDTTYRFAVSAVNQPRYHVAVTAVDNTQNRNESELSEVASLDVGEALESPLSTELTATPAATEPYPNLPDEGCFIATAAFGADWAAEVQILRDFRDRFLATHAAGRWLVRQYYAHGPRGAAWLNDHPALKPLVRAALLPLVAAALALLAAPWAACAALLAIAIGVRALFRAAIARIGVRALLRAAIGVRALLPRIGLRPLLGRIGLRALLGIAVAVGLGGSPPSATAQPRDATFSPRWMYELKGGWFYPDLELYDRFYSDDRDTFSAVSGSYRVRDWLEVGAEIGHMRDEGRGVAGGDGEGAEVTLRLVPVQAFANFMYQPRPERRFVPYAGVGVGAVWYEQDVELQSSRDGRSDVATVVRAGLRWRIASEGPRSAETRRPDTTYWRSYVFIEAQALDADVDDIDLGGKSYLLGFRIEFELGR